MSKVLAQGINVLLSLVKLTHIYVLPDTLAEKISHSSYIPLAHSPPSVAYNHSRPCVYMTHKTGLYYNRLHQLYNH
ncbi:MAG: hypothetical protein H6Q68_280 [Firmicutes bacterium]|nr:hypothetical protein [Bacillota bacterium]